MSEVDKALDSLVRAALTHPNNKDISLEELVGDFSALGITKTQMLLSFARIHESGRWPNEPTRVTLPEGYPEYTVTFYFKDRSDAIDFLEQHAPNGLETTDSKVTYNIPGH